MIVRGRAPQRTAVVVEAVEEVGGDVTFALGDLAVEKGADAVYAAASSGVPVGILVNNTGVLDASRSWTDLAASDRADIYSVNVLSSLRMIQRFVCGMRERGRVIQVRSGTGELPVASQPHYAATNGARDSLAEYLAREPKNTGVTSNAVAAGGILTPANQPPPLELRRRSGWGEAWEGIEPRLVEALSPNGISRIGRRRSTRPPVAFLASSAVRLCHRDHPRGGRRAGTAEPSWCVRPARIRVTCLTGDVECVSLCACHPYGRRWTQADRSAPWGRP
ncbi:SDR family NAD(P)-dependent oxidoreductase [Streptomyces sp. NPDC008122]|uniref:SDR family NAD(P)-dependent oxidoreductase n=1 Tax=Streptomyces sp. NPDC008122 TaxID=3364810 RepID=UPI0036EE266B